MPEEPPWSYGLFIPHDPRAVGVVRATVRSVLRAARLDCLVDTAELLVSELVTNAYRYSETDAYVSVDRSSDGVRVAVWDAGDAQPHAFTAQLDDENGRGLSIVETCADAWGVDDYTDKDAGLTGKAVWFNLRPQSP
ncbi:ATP-binding protein [Streptomyces pathocidini]|uniref:ATP-binding protein n=1 Tax=Streptomyces pathocidini TaxID=1650571 RepID=A0ABW7UN15_9ACTN|nr:ATP-binding protein [Streptomyces pathocidini]